MHKTQPKIFLVGETTAVEEGINDFLKHIGAPDWKTDAPSDSEKIEEIMGRLCYRSFGAGLNPNVKRVREGNRTYLQNVVAVKHGSVLEHTVVNFIFADVSRVLTHELVRHRAGTAISQESLRFVRLDDLGQWLPTVIREDEQATEIFVKTFEQLEELQLQLAEHFDLDGEKMPFAQKKIITSAMRRIAPIGLSTSIGWSANMRALRHLIEMRTEPVAEEEIRLVFGQVAEICQRRYPNIFADYEIEMVEGLPWYRTVNRKV
ncbi:MAG: FAD-dependent thymidylate synthase [Candidatus Buchananbacteria bacterium]|nr:FAD-dependent thymidylate synthase [Candidatus Buchananbacteria bacterium]